MLKFVGTFEHWTHKENPHVSGISMHMYRFTSISLDAWWSHRLEPSQLQNRQVAKSCLWLWVAHHVAVATWANHMQKGYPTCSAINDTSSYLLPPSCTSSSWAAVSLLLLGWDGEWNMRGCTSKRWRDVKDLMLDVMAFPTRAGTVRIKSTPYSNYRTFSCQLECRQDLICST